MDRKPVHLLLAALLVLTLLPVSALAYAKEYSSHSVLPAGSGTTATDSLPGDVNQTSDEGVQADDPTGRGSEVTVENPKTTPGATPGETPESSGNPITGEASEPSGDTNIGEIFDPVDDATTAEESDSAGDMQAAEENDETAVFEEELEALAKAKDAAPLAPGRYILRSSLSLTRVVDISGANTSSGGNVQLYTSNMTGAQLFEFSYDDVDGFYTIKNVNSGLVLDVAGAGTKAGTNVQQYKSNGTQAQRWFLSDLGDGSFKITSALNKNLVLDVSGAADADGTNVQVYTANGTYAQSFVPLPERANPVSERTLDDGRYVIGSALSSNRAIDVSGASTKNGVQMQIWTKNGTIAQIYDIRYQSDGYYSIRTLNSGAYLGAQSDNIVSSTPVIQWSQTQEDGQKWAIKVHGDGTCTFIGKRSGLALDVSGANTAAGTKLQLWQQNGTAAQRFKVVAASEEPLDEGVANIFPYSRMDKCIDVAGGSRVAGADVQVYTVNGTLAQKFLVKRVGARIYTFQSINSGYYLTDSGAHVTQAAAPGNVPVDEQKWKASWTFGGFTLVNVSTGRALALATGGMDGHDLGTSALTGVRAQVFRWQASATVGEGTYTLSTDGGMVVDSSGGKIVSGTNTQVWSTNDTAAQKWKLVQDGGEYFSLRCVRSNRALDIAGGSTANGTNVRLWDHNGTAAQLWRALPTGDGWFYLQSKNGTYLTTVGKGDTAGQNVHIASSVASARKFRFDVTAYQGRTIDPGKPMIAITIDGGPSSGTAAYVDVLGKYDARATFYATGTHMAAGGRYLKYATDNGHEVGNHTYTHPILSNLSAAGIRNEISRTNDAIASATGVWPATMRPPYGALNGTVSANVGMPIIMWSIDTRDWETTSTPKTANSIMGARDGDIVLIHDISTSVAALDIALANMTARGYQFVTVSELAAYKGYTLYAGSRYSSFR